MRTACWKTIAPPFSSSSMAARISTSEASGLTTRSCLSTLALMALLWPCSTSAYLCTASTNLALTAASCCILTWTSPSGSPR